MVMMKGSATAVLSVLLVYLSPVKSSGTSANSIVERNSKSERPYGVYAGTFTQRATGSKPNEALDDRSESMVAWADKLTSRAANGRFGEPYVAPILPRETSTSASTISVVRTSSTLSAASFPSSSSPPSIQCFCNESGCSPESPPCCSNGSCAVPGVKSEADAGSKIRLSFYMGLLSVVIAFLMS